MGVAIAHVAVAIGAVLLVNADAENIWLAFWIWSAASLVLGWVGASLVFLPLPLLAIPFAVPFEYADQWLGSDAPLVWLFAALAGLIQVGVLFLATCARRLRERMKPSHN